MTSYSKNHKNLPKTNVLGRFPFIAPPMLFFKRISGVHLENLLIMQIVVDVGVKNHCQ